MISYHIIGVMSGTSTDGLDIAFVLFEFDENKKLWTHNLLHSKMYDYPTDLSQKLKHAKEINGLSLKRLDNELGRFIGETINQFINEQKIDRSTIDAIASHGHTIFHLPNEKLTLQIGNGQFIASTTKIRTITNFREKDVVYGGQGAPLVPIGDLLLFASYAQSFLNLGGFANITHISGNQILAYDICPCNLPLNKYATLIGYPYDHNGELGKSISYHNEGLVKTLNNLPFYAKSHPKSLGAEWFENNFSPLLDIDELTAQEKLKICYDHISEQISLNINKLGAKDVLITGGGAKNKYLIECIQAKTSVNIIIPDTLVIDFKEAIVFGFLGALHLANQPNCLREVTGAYQDSISGNVYYP